MDLIDLHTHTTASDGSLSPGELVALAARAGLKAVAVTDHDTIDGLDEALAAGSEAGIEVVPGVEISVQGGPTGSMHMLGLLLDHLSPGLVESLARLQLARAERNPKIVQRFNEMGIPMTMEEVAAHAGGELVGRPHFARVLLERGIVRDRGEAFARYLGAGAPAYVAKHRFSPAEGMAMIRAAGGVPVLAHPGMLKLATGDLEKLVRELMRDGLEGIEALYSEHDQAQRNWLTSLAARLGLVISGGTDFHGQAKPDLRLGLGWGDLRVPPGVLAGLKQRRDRLRGTACGDREDSCLCS
jgi:predicted metal-dependent phosphoesterase TrpH